MSNLGNMYSFNAVIEDNRGFLIGNSQKFTFAGVKLHLPIQVRAHCARASISLLVMHDNQFQI